MPCDNTALFKGLTLAFCVVCLVFKTWTTWEAMRVALIQQKQSREWHWQSFTARGAFSILLMDATFGAYTLISLAFLIGHVAGDPKTKAEVFLLVIGFILMFIIGGMLVTWIDDVPHELFDNTIILAVFAILTGILLLIDAGVGRSSGKPKPKPVPKAKPKREIKFFHRKEKTSTQVKQEEAPKVEKAPQVEKVPEQTKKEEIVKVESQQTQTSPHDTHPYGEVIRSVEIRIKEPKKGVANLDVLSEAERVDGLLQEREEPRVEYVMRSPRFVPQVKSSPIRHTSSHYIHGVPTPFAWQRLHNQN